MSEHLIPERLRNVREGLGITMAEASRRMNLSKIGYCRYEYGDRSPSPQTIEVIAKALCTSVDYLIGLTDDPSADTITIDKKSDPVLFELVSNITSKEDTIKRLLEYYNRLNQ